MKREFLNYNQWQDTADTLHALLQIAGKIKLERCEKRPEWAQVRLYLTTEGLTTGLIPSRKAPFEIFFNLRKHEVDVRSANGKYVMIALSDDFPVCDFYKELMKALHFIGSPTEICLQPQEFEDSIPFDQDNTHRSYDIHAISIFLDNLLFAHRSLTGFLSPFRGKVNFPALYFGTMDLSGSVYSGKHVPYEEDDKVSIIAYDEQCCEFGFWPGDTNWDRPSFYVMPYPFLRGIEGYEGMLKPNEATFLPDNQQFIFTLEDAFTHEYPEEAVKSFCQSSFAILQHLDRWEHIKWITKPLPALC